MYDSDYYRERVRYIESLQDFIEAFGDDEHWRAMPINEYSAIEVQYSILAEEPEAAQMEFDVLSRELGERFGAETTVEDHESIEHGLARFHVTSAEFGISRKVRYRVVWIEKLPRPDDSDDMRGAQR